MADTRVDVEDGKYTWVVNDLGEISCLRFRQEWIPCNLGAFSVGSKALIALIHELHEARQKLKHMQRAYDQDVGGR